MILSDRDIKKAIKAGRIVIDPYDESSVQPASVDLHLGQHFMVFRGESSQVIDPKKPMEPAMRRIKIDQNKPFVLQAGGFALGMIYEKTGVANDLVGRLEGKSSLGRLGLLIHVTAGFLDPGNCLKMTLELHNTANMPILLYYRMPIAQMAFEQLSSSCGQPYAPAMGGKYFGDQKPRASQMWQNFTN